MGLGLEEEAGLFRFEKLLPIVNGKVLAAIEFSVLILHYGKWTDERDVSVVCSPTTILDVVLGKKLSKK